MVGMFAPLEMQRSDVLFVLYHFFSFGSRCNLKSHVVVLNLSLPIPSRVTLSDTGDGFEVPGISGGSA